VEKEGKAWEKRKVFSLDLKTAKESLLKTVFGSEFQTAGAEHRKARFANVVVVLSASCLHNITPTQYWQLINISHCVL